MLVCGVYKVFYQVYGLRPKKCKIILDISLDYDKILLRPVA